MKLYKEQLGHATKQKRLSKGCEKWQPRFQAVEGNALNDCSFVQATTGLLWNQGSQI